MLSKRQILCFILNFALDNTSLLCRCSEGFVIFSLILGEEQTGTMSVQEATKHQMHLIPIWNFKGFCQLLKQLSHKSNVSKKWSNSFKQTNMK